MESNFDKTSESFVTTQGVPYDYGSVMHYGAFDFSRNGQPTILPLDGNVALSDLGQRQGFSPSDVTHVNVLYCGGKFISTMYSHTSALPIIGHQNNYYHNCDFVY